MPDIIDASTRMGNIKDTAECLRQLVAIHLREGDSCATLDIYTLREFLNKTIRRATEAADLSDGPGILDATSPFTRAAKLIATADASDLGAYYRRITHFIDADLTPVATQGRDPSDHRQGELR